MQCFFPFLSRGPILLQWGPTATMSKDSTPHHHNQRRYGVGSGPQPRNHSRKPVFGSATMQKGSYIFSELGRPGRSCVVHMPKANEFVTLPLDMCCVHDSKFWWKFLSKVYMGSVTKTHTQGQTCFNCIYDIVETWICKVQAVPLSQCS